MVSYNPDMFEELEQKEKHIIAGSVFVVLLVGFGAGYTTAGGSNPGSGDAASEAEIRSQVQGLLDQQVARQRQQLQQVANQSENLTMEDVSISGSVDTVEQSQFGSLYKATITLSGDIPRRTGGGTRSVNQEQAFYLSNDGQYLFQEPTNLQQAQQPQRQGQRTTPTQ